MVSLFINNDKAVFGSCSEWGYVATEPLVNSYGGVSASRILVDPSSTDFSRLLHENTQNTSISFHSIVRNGKVASCHSRVPFPGLESRHMFGKTKSTADMDSIAITEGSTSSETTFDIDSCASEPDDSLYELFDDVSVLTADSTMDGMEDDLGSEAEPDYYITPVHPFDDDRCTDVDEYDLQLASEPQNLVLNLDILRTTPDDRNHASDCRLNETRELGPCSGLTYATEDSRLMSFLVDFCSEGSKLSGLVR